MLNRNLIGGGWSNQESSIYEVTIGTHGFYDGYGKSIVTSDDIGSISNDRITINNKEYIILGLFACVEPDNFSLFSVNDSIDYNEQQVYISRYDDHVIYTIDYVYVDRPDFILYKLKSKYTNIFGYEDFDKTISVWISTTPPPLVRRRASNWLARIATFTERWHDA